MSKRNKDRRDKDTGKSLNVLKNLSEETMQAVFAVIFFVLAVFFILSAIDRAGVAGRNVFKILSAFLGLGYFLLPLLFVILAVAFLRSLRKNLALTQLVGSLLFLGSGLGLLNLVSVDGGGVIGKIISMPLVKLFDSTATFILLIALLLISLLVVFDSTLRFSFLLYLWNKLLGKKEKTEEELAVKIAPNEELEENVMLQGESEMAQSKDSKKTIVPVVEKSGKEDSSGIFLNSNRFGASKPFVPPPLSLLEKDSGKPGVGDIKANSNIIKRTLMNFGIDVEMDEISIGPSVTRYALKPAEGVKLSRIVGLQNDLALALAAHPLRIEAPIPGKSLVGIEIPNVTKTTVGLGTLLLNEEYQSSGKSLLMALGKGISGKSHFGNLAKMPHLLIAGATGSGKSVTIHAIITSLLYRNSPENLKFMMIDPKRVELTLYNKIPHLLTPVITDAKKSILALKWAAKEMDRRYDVLESESVRDIESYHKNVVEPELKKFQEKGKETDPEKSKFPEMMPYIIIIIDELADIMQTYPRELEAAIVRLAQMSRAVGIHLILSTQRPSVNVITGLIKANIPSRIALQVTSQIDSRTILDASGAEKLLGAGDMLYMSGEMSKPQRIQSSFISEAEVKSVVKFLADSYKDEIPNEIDLVSAQNSKNAIFEGSVEEDESADDDELYEEAREIVMQAGKASTSYLQRKLRIGYARAARLIDMLEERGVISGGIGAKPREVLGETGATEDARAEETSV